MYCHDFHETQCILLLLLLLFTISKCTDMSDTVVKRCRSIAQIVDRVSRVGSVVDKAWPVMFTRTLGKKRRDEVGIEQYCSSRVYPSAHWSQRRPVTPGLHGHWPLSRHKLLYEYSTLHSHLLHPSPDRQTDRQTHTHTHTHTHTVSYHLRSLLSAVTSGWAGSPPQRWSLLW